MEVAMAQSILSNHKTAQQSLRAAAEDLAGEIATLNTLEAAALLQKWKALFGTDPSPLLARIFMVRAIAYRLQEQRTRIRGSNEGNPANHSSLAPPASFRLLYVMIILTYDRSKTVRFAVTRHPNSGWLARQLTEAFPRAQSCTPPTCKTLLRTKFR